MNRKILIFKIVIGISIGIVFWSYFKMRLERISAIGESQHYQKTQDKVTQQRLQAQEKMGYTAPKQRRPSHSNPKNSKLDSTR